MKLRNLPFSVQSARCLLAVLLCALWAVGCSVDNVPSGGLVVSLETDLAVPKDIDRVLVECSQNGRTFYSVERQIGEGHELMPLQLRVSNPGNNDPVLVRAVAFQGPQARIERSLITPMPSNYLASVRVPLNYLCVGKVGAAGESSCGADQTCKQGECGGAQLPAELLVRYEPNVRATRSAATIAADGGMDAAVAASLSSTSTDERCFDVASCFYQALDIEVEPVTCSFALPPDILPEQLNIALRLPLGQPGICENGSCFVVLDENTEGYQIEAGRVYVPLGVCDRMLATAGGAITLGLACPKKTLDNPICGPWTSVKTPVPSLDATTDGNTGIVVGTQPSRPSLLQGACSGVARQACGMCGTQARECRDGTWSMWAACVSAGACVAGTSEACADGGKRTCGGDCMWGACMAQTCTGPSSRACGNCGTQTRTCQNGMWAEWTACASQGACVPNATQACAAGGNQACGGSCQWGECGTGACAGPASESCGNCGTRTRTCDPASGKYSEWGACQAAGVCMPDVTRACGLAGMQTCRGDCQWGEGCANQMCEGESERPCGNCGTQSRSCNTENGAWTDWGECAEQGECAPNAARTCGKGGVQICGGNCRWDAACAGQRCMGTAARSCGNCGIQLRLCDTLTGEFPDWSTAPCLNLGECPANSTRDCGNGGKQFCGADCRWQGGCGDQMCRGRGMRKDCGNCGSQSAVCDAATGMWSTTQYGECTGQGCIPRATEPCGTNNIGTRTCSGSCGWGTCQCNPNTKPSTTCGLCGLGTQAVSCNDTTGEWSLVGACVNPGECTGSMTASCGMGGTKTCNSSTCMYGSCMGEKKVCPPEKKPPPTCGLCGDGTQIPSCNDKTGEWSVGACSKPGECTGMMAVSCGDGGTKTCNPSTCMYGSCSGEKKECPPADKPTKCGLCNLGTQMSTCNDKTGQWIVVAGTCTNPGECTGSMGASCGDGGTKMCNASTCIYGSCSGEKKECPPADKPTKCGLCNLGTQMSTCNDKTGQWIVVAGTCTNPGECTGSTGASCGDGGTKMCIANTCMYGSCTGEKKECPPADKPIKCGLCGLGTQTSTCNDKTGQWMVVAGTCTNPGECMGTTTASCGTGGTKTCNSSTCMYGSCMGEKKDCLTTQPSPESCGRCGTKSFTCDTTKGEWVAGACLGQHGECEPPATQLCPGGGSRQSCTSTCTWNPAICPPVPMGGSSAPVPQE